MLRPIINAHKNINLTECGGVWRRVWGLMEKDGTYIVAGVMVGGGKWYLRCFRDGVVSFDYYLFYFILFLLEVLDGLSVWVEVREKLFVLVPTF